MGEAPLEPCDLADEQVKLAMQGALPEATETDVSAVRTHAVSQDASMDASAAEQQEVEEPPSHLPDEYVPSGSPEEIMFSFEEGQSACFIRMWSVLPAHVRDVKFDLDERVWKAEDIGALSGVKCGLLHRFFG